MYKNKFGTYKIKSNVKPINAQSMNEINLNAQLCGLNPWTSAYHLLSFPLELYTDVKTWDPIVI